MLDTETRSYIAEQAIPILQTEVRERGQRITALETERDLARFDADTNLRVIDSLQADKASLQRHVAALRQLLAQQWTPVDDGVYETVHIEDNGTWLAINDRDSDGLKSYLGTTLSTDLRLCQRTQEPTP